MTGLSQLNFGERGSASSLPAPALPDTGPSRALAVRRTPLEQRVRRANLSVMMIGLLGEAA